MKNMQQMECYYPKKKVSPKDILYKASLFLLLLAVVVLSLLLKINQVQNSGNEYSEVKSLSSEEESSEADTIPDQSEDNNGAGSALESKYNDAGAFKNAEVGSTIYFGSYEQDNNTSNGKEDIEWIVLAKEDNKILVISKYALDCQPYNRTYSNVTWETCTLRTWLNETFLNTAFSEEEQLKIINTSVSADENPCYSTDSGNATTDKIYLLSITEAETYFISNTVRTCKATAYAQAKEAYIYNENCYWWLRTPGEDQEDAIIVQTGGSFYYSGYIVSGDSEAIRPALWIYLGSEDNINKENGYNAAVTLYTNGQYEEAIDAFKALGNYKDSKNQIQNIESFLSDRYNDAISLSKNGHYEEAIAAFEELGDYKDSKTQIENIRPLYYQELFKNAEAGSTIYFGSYEQDNNTSNGKEDIEWIILAKEDNKILVISKYALDCQPYNKTWTSVTWETCTLRTWLNETFLNAAFSDEEQSKVISASVSADQNPCYSTDSGNATNDKIFLLSASEAETYFISKTARTCKATAYAQAKEAYIYNENCYWWLRTPGEDQEDAIIVQTGGSFYYSGYIVSGDSEAIRPALWITLGS